MSSPPSDKDADRSAWGMLQRARPGVDWERSTLRRADLIGDGTVCRVMIGHDDDRNVWVGLVRPGREGPANPQVFGVGRPLSLAFHPLQSSADCAPGGEPLDGCTPKKGRQGLTITVADTQVTRVYWHATAKRFVTFPR